MFAQVWLLIWRFFLFGSSDIHHYPWFICRHNNTWWLAFDLEHKQTGSQQTVPTRVPANFVAYIVCSLPLVWNQSLANSFETINNDWSPRSIAPCWENRRHKKPEGRNSSAELFWTCGQLVASLVGFSTVTNSILRLPHSVLPRYSAAGVSMLVLKCNCRNKLREARINHIEVEDGVQMQFDSFYCE